MSYLKKISELATDAEELEQIYRSAQSMGETAAFKSAIDEQHEAAPENLLFAAWYYRLKDGATTAKEFVIQWAWLLPLALLNGLICWLLTDEERFMIQIEQIRTPEITLTGDYDVYPYFLLLAGPLCALFMLIYFSTAARQHAWRKMFFAAVPLLAAAYVLWAYPQLGSREFQEQYLWLMALLMPILSWAMVGAFFTAEHPEPQARFAFLSKSLEAVVMGGLFAIAGGIFISISVGLFDALGVQIPDDIFELVLSVGAGAVPVIVAVLTYDPAKEPAQQSSNEGLSRLVSLLMRLLLPLTLIVSLIYLAFIPANFSEPFENRDVLIVYNVMQFAILALLIGATPRALTDLSPRVAEWLRRGIVALAGVTLLVSVYALAAIVYRTYLGAWTPNRITFMSINVINIGILAYLLRSQTRVKAGDWIAGIFRACKIGSLAYVLWAAAMIAALPWIFRVLGM